VRVWIFIDLLNETLRKNPLELKTHRRKTLDRSPREKTLDRSLKMFKFDHTSHIISVTSRGKRQFLEEGNHEYFS